MRRCTIDDVGLSRCRVTYSDSDGLEHAIEVEAESLYEAVALAVAQFREDEVSPLDPAPMQEFVVEVLRKPVQHRIRLKQVDNWAKPTAMGGPAQIVRRERVRKLLGHS